MSVAVLFTLPKGKVGLSPACVVTLSCLLPVEEGDDRVSGEGGIHLCHIPYTLLITSLHKRSHDVPPYPAEIGSVLLPLEEQGTDNLYQIKDVVKL